MIKLSLLQTFSPISGCLIKSSREGKWSTLLKDCLSSKPLQLRIKCYLQKTSSSKYWNINIQQLSNRILQQLLKH